jgi:hypothetical protein
MYRHGNIFKKWPVEEMCGAIEKDAETGTPKS